MMKMTDANASVDRDSPETKDPARDDVSRNGSTYGVFQSKDPIVPLEKDVEARGGNDPHASGPVHRTTYIETMQHLYKGNVGSGTFALGDAFKNAGLMLAGPLTIILGVICIHAQYMLLYCSEEVMRRTKRNSEKYPDYATTVELCFATGPLKIQKYSNFMRKLVNLFICITQLGFCCVYFVFIATNMQQVIEALTSKTIELHLLMGIVFIPMMLSTWIRNLKFLAPLSTVANLLITYGFIATIYMLCQDLPPIGERRYVANWSTLPLFFGTVIYCFEGIALVLPLKNEMKKPSNFDKPLGVLNIGMTVIGAMFVLLGFMSYWKYGDGIKGSVTLNLEPQTDILPLSIRLAISISIVSSYALQFYVPIGFTWPVLEDRFGPFRHPAIVETVYRTFICFITFVLAEAIPELGLFISLIGAVSSTALALLFPPVIQMVVLWQNGTLSVFTIIKNAIILLIGVLGCVTGTYESISQIVQFFGKST